MTIPAVLPTYARYDIAFDQGEGVWLTATDGRRFLDFGAGVAVTALGHAHPKLVAALREQAGKLWHTSNLYHVPGQQRVAEILRAHTFADTVFFCNSGAEAMECALKMARRHHQAAGRDKRTVLVARGGFHGRTLATIGAAGNEKYLDGFAPAMPGFVHVAFGNLNETRAAIDDTTAAVLVEPVQGEGGIRPADAHYLRGLRALCDEYGLLMILDEVQTGVGRTGKLYAHEWAGVTPDIMASAKGLGGGFPVGACLATENAASGMVPGTHGSTYGGNPLAMAVAEAVLTEVLADGFLDHVQAMGALLMDGLRTLAARHPAVIEEVRGHGLMLGLKCRPEVVNGDLVKAAIAQGLLTVPAGDNVVRLLPPLIIGEGDVATALSMLEKACETLEDRAPEGRA
ncbi:aspartate aminotransferase family protein [Novispirillum sp. DQ9]|uniref:aspartate aminotransferase family protein n=1 Tax=Novispirillum sp. DQ9 TaxID=3398612 RepID=UPI003C7B53A3